MHSNPNSCLASIEAFEAAPLNEVAGALLTLLFTGERWAARPEGVIDELVLSAIPGVRGGGFTVSPAVRTARMVCAEAVQALERAGLLMRVWGDLGTYTATVTRRGVEAIASGDPAAAL